MKKTQQRTGILAGILSFVLSIVLPGYEPPKGPPRLGGTYRPGLPPGPARGTQTQPKPRRFSRLLVILAIVVIAMNQLYPHLVANNSAAAPQALPTGLVPTMTAIPPTALPPMATPPFGAQYASISGTSIRAAIDIIEPRTRTSVTMFKGTTLPEIQDEITGVANSFVEEFLRGSNDMYPPGAWLHQRAGDPTTYAQWCELREWIWKLAWHKEFIPANSIWLQNSINALYALEGADSPNAKTLYEAVHGTLTRLQEQARADAEATTVANATAEALAQIQATAMAEAQTQAQPAPAEEIQPEPMPIPARERATHTETGLLTEDAAIARLQESLVPSGAGASISGPAWTVSPIHTLFFFSDMYDLFRLTAAQKRPFWIVEKRYAGTLTLGSKTFHKWYVYYSSAVNGKIDPDAAPTNLLNIDGTDAAGNYWLVALNLIPQPDYPYPVGYRIWKQSLVVVLRKKIGI